MARRGEKKMCEATEAAQRNANARPPTAGGTKKRADERPKRKS